MIDFYRLLKNKKTGKTHCPICLNKLRIIKIPNSKIEVFVCNECEKYFSKEGEGQ